MAGEKKVLVDCSQISQTPRGMGLYTIDLVRALSANGNLLLVFKSNSYNRRLCKSLGLSKQAVFIPLPQIIIEQLLIPLIILFSRVGAYVSVGNSVSLVGCRLCDTYLLLHDIYFTKKIDLQHYSLKRRLARIYRYLTVSLSILSCKSVITVSKYMKKQISVRFTNLQEDKLHVIPNMLRYELTNCSKENRDVLLVTGSDPQKNAAWALKILSTMDDKIDNIYVVGINAPEDVGLRYMERVHYLGFQGQSELEAIYESCLLFVLPSLEESFGVPIIEALSKNCRVCASNTGALPEVGGKFAMYFELNNEDSFKNAVGMALSKSHNWQGLSTHLRQYERSTVTNQISALIQ